MISISRSALLYSNLLYFADGEDTTLSVLFPHLDVCLALILIPEQRDTLPVNLWGFIEWLTTAPAVPAVTAVQRRVCAGRVYGLRVTL